MKFLKTLFIVFFGIFLVGCSTQTSTKNSQKPIFYERLATSDRSKIKFEFKATAKLDATEIKNNQPPVEIDAKITNKCQQPIKFDLAHFQLVNLTNHPTATKVITINPQETKKIEGLFVDVYQIITINPLIVSYFAGKFEVGKISMISNHAELDQWVLKHQPTDGNTDNTKYTDTQLIAWIGNVLTKMHNGKLTRDDYLYRISTLGGIKIISVQENHQGPNMQSRGADPTTSPVIYQLYLNDKNQLEDYVTHEIFSDTYPG